MEKKITISHVNVRQSIAFLLLRLVLLDLVTGVLVISFFSPLFIPAVSLSGKILFVSHSLGIVILLTLFKVILTLYVVLEWLDEYYEIFPDSVVHKRGLFFRKIDRYTFENVKSIGMEQGLFGRILNYGTLHFYDWKLQKTVYIYLIHNPKKYLLIIESLLPTTAEEKHIIREKLKEEEIDD